MQMFSNTKILSIIDFYIKASKKGLDSKELARFRREYDVMRTLSSPYVVEVYNYNSAKMSILWNIWMIH